jgi:hypothetical protein
VLWISPSAGITGKCDFDTPFRKNSEKQREAARFPAVSSAAEPARTQDFRQKPDLSC